MIGADSVTVSTVVAVCPADAFEVFTEEIDAWWGRGPKYRFGRNGTLRFEPGVGGRLVEVYDDVTGDLWEVGRIKVWEPASRLVFAWRTPVNRPGESTEVEVRFEEHETGTRVTVVHRGWDQIPDDHPVRHGQVGEAFIRFIGGWWIDTLGLLRAAASAR